MSDTEAIDFDIMVEFYLRHRDDPLYRLMSVSVSPSAIERHGSEAVIHTIMVQATTDLLDSIDTKGQTRFVVVDAKHNHHIVMVDELQSITILAPDEDMMEQRLREYNESE